MAQKDIIMKRDGSELQVRIIQMNSKYVVYNLESKHDKEDKQIDNRKIYMIKFQKRGNVFFTEQGDRFDGEGDGKVPKGSTVVYLKEGKEILVYDLSMDTNKISYKLSKKKKDSFKYTPKYQVFMIVYPDGTKDIISEFERPKEVQQKVQGPQVKPREEDKSQFVSRSEPTFNSGEAVILTEKNFVIKAVVTQEDENTISFYRKGFTKGPLYHIGKQHVKRIDYIKTNNKSKKRRK
ncbi:MAG: hypothetical protein IJ190_07830 [Prevotella sp.]|nr:hypothetical protein [Prevotella sp.]